MYLNKLQIFFNEQSIKTRSSNNIKKILSGNITLNANKDTLKLKLYKHN